MSTRTSLGRTSMMVPLTISPAAKRMSLCFMASSMVSIGIFGILTAGDPVSEMRPTKAPLPNGPDVAVAAEVDGQVVRLTSRFSAQMNSRTYGVQASGEDRPALRGCKD